MKTNFILVIGIILLTLSGCKKNESPTGPDNNFVSSKIEVGTSVDVATQSVSTGGGTIKIDKAGDPLNGMEITVEPNSFSSIKNFKVSYAEIKSHSLGDKFNPITPLISISYEGGYSEKPMEVKIPVSLPTGHFAMAFFYDDQTGEVEGLPVEELSSTSITVSTSTFSSASSLSKRSKHDDATSIGKMVISSISESILNAQSIISSGFTLGVDDWEFVNYGSYIAPGGHCAGQSMAAMWYYYEKKLKGETSLFHKLDEVNDKTKPGLLWQDNPLGYRFASTIQKDFNWEGWVKDMEFRSLFPNLVWNAFAYSMFLTGEPQSVLIRNSNGEGGHAMIVHKVNMTEKKLYIADPNYPNNRVANDGSESIRTIDLVNGKFKAYETGLTAGAQSTTMDQIAYFGKTAYINWGQLAVRWAEVLNKTIGNDRFPKYTLWVEDGSGYELADGLNTDADTLIFHCKSTDCIQYLNGTDHYQALEVYNVEGKLICSNNNKGQIILPLASGQNKFGVYIKGARDNSADNYVDFKWINVYRQNLYILPDPLNGKPDEEYEFVARTDGSAPKNAKFIWNFGDASNSVTVNNDSTVKHTFTKEGEFTVIVELYDNATNKKVGAAYSSVNIAKERNLLNLLHTMKTFGVSCSFDFLLPGGSDYSQGISFFKYDNDTLKWNGTSFSYDDADEEDFDSYGYKTNYYHTVSGTVSSDGKTILELKTKYTAVYYSYMEWSETHTEEMNFTNIPIIHYPGYQDWGGEYSNFLYELKEDEAKSHVSFVKWTWEEKDKAPHVNDNIKEFWAPLQVTFRNE
ncbi:MAG: PKD domain-containing protein [Ignavibacteriales bacterium]|nr:MAG: PKD domain-containing protein [Ignavibacteriales bacterium]